jgi:hypothetical protein
MEAICSSETSVETQRTTRRHIPEDETLHNHRCENLKSYIKETCFASFELATGNYEPNETCYTCSEASVGNLWLWHLCDPAKRNLLNVLWTTVCYTLGETKRFVCCKPATIMHWGKWNLLYAL